MGGHIPTKKRVELTIHGGDNMEEEGGGREEVREGGGREGGFWKW